MLSVSRQARRLALPSLAALTAFQAACATPASTAATNTPMPVPAPGMLPMKYAGGPTTAEISAADLMTRLYVFADDSMQGREFGELGNVKGTDYLAAQARAIGLEPAGDNGTFFQTLPVITRGVQSGAALTVTGGSALALGTDVLAVPPIPQFPFGAGRAFQNVAVVYGGNVGDTTLTAAQMAGKVVLLGAPMNAQGAPAFAFWQHPRAGRYGSAAAVAIVTLELTPPPIVGYFREPQTMVSKGEAMDTARSGAWIVTARAAEQLLGRPLAGATVGMTGRTVTSSVRFTDATSSTPARNVVAILRGSDPVLRNQFVAIGAHNDHVGMGEPVADHDSLRAYLAVVRPQGAEDRARPATAEEMVRIRAALDSMRALRPTARVDSVFNGADDDGSGSVTVLEIAQSMAAMPTKPKRSTIFVWHTGEEAGLFGAEWFTDHPTVPRDSIVAQLNMDMVGRGTPADVPNGGPGYLQLIGSRRLSTELGNIVEAVNVGGRHGFTFDYAYDADGHPANYYCRSDHYQYARYGIPVTFFSTGGHRDYHQLTDEPQYIDYPHMAKVATLVRDIAVNVADLDHRVVRDKPKPDPNGTCKQ